MDLYLMRHGLAVDAGTGRSATDFDRELTPEGREKTRAAARSIVAMGLSFDCILSSPYPRARQTAEIVGRALKLKKAVQGVEALEPGGSFHALCAVVQLLKPAPSSLLLVGHEPYLGQLAGLLISGPKGARVAFKKGGLCKLAVEGTLEPCRCAVLEWLLTPKQMGLMK